MKASERYFEYMLDREQARDAFQREQNKKIAAMLKREFEQPFEEWVKDPLQLFQRFNTSDMQTALEQVLPDEAY